jgi:dihydrofolate reductase
MGAVCVHEFMSLDGVIEDPRWTFDYGFDPQLGERLAAITNASKAILLGRRTFEMFAPAWSTRTAEDDPGAPFFNDTPKYVVSDTLQDPAATWRNSELLGPYDVKAIQALKDRVDGNIYVSGSGMLVRHMLEDGLVDQLHLIVFPLTLGTGQRLFGDGASSVKMTRVACDALDNGAIYVQYDPQT